MGNRFSSGQFAIAECDRCAQRFKLRQLKRLVIKTKNVDILVCPECWEPDQPQLQLGMYPVDDPQAVRDPRPDFNAYWQSGLNGLQLTGNVGPSPQDTGSPEGGSRVIQWGWNPVGLGDDGGVTPNDLVANGQIGNVTVTSEYICPVPPPEIPTIVSTNAKLIYDFSNCSCYNPGSMVVYDLSGNGNNGSVNSPTTLTGPGYTAHIVLNDTKSLTIPPVITQETEFTYYFVYYGAACTQFNAVGWNGALFSYDSAPVFVPNTNGGGGFGSGNRELGGYTGITNGLFRMDLSGEDEASRIYSYAGGYEGYYSNSLVGSIVPRTSGVTIGGVITTDPELQMVLLYETATAPALNDVYLALKDRFNL